MKHQDRFKKKYGIDAIDFVEKADLEYFGLAKTIGIQSVLKSYAEKKGMNIEFNDEFNKDLVEAFVEAGKKFPYNEKITFKEEIYQIEPTPVNPPIPKSKGVLEDFKDIVSKDVFRENLSAIYVSDDGFLYGTDAHKLIRYKNNDYSEYAGKLINLKVFIDSKGKKLDFVDARPLQYETVIPKNNPEVIKNLPTYNFYNFAKSVVAVKKLLSSDIFNVIFDFKGESFGFNPILMSDVFHFALCKGFDTFTLEYSTPNKAIVFNFKDDSLGLLMPIMVKEDSLMGTTKTTIEQIVSDYGYSKSMPKAKSQKATKVEVKEVPYKKFEGSMNQTTYVPRRDISYLVLRNGEQLSGNDIIDGVYKIKKMAKGGGVGDSYNIKNIKIGDRIKDKYNNEAEVWYNDGEKIDAQYVSGASYVYRQKDFDNGEVRFLWADRNIMKTGGGVGNKMVAFPEELEYKYFVVDEDNDNYLTVQEDMFDKWKNANKTEKAEYYSEWIPKNEMIEVMAKGGGVGDTKSGDVYYNEEFYDKNWKLQFSNVHSVESALNSIEELKKDKDLDYKELHYGHLFEKKNKYIIIFRKLKMLEKGGGVGEPYDSMTKYQLDKEYKKLNEKRDILKKKYGKFDSSEIVDNEKQIDKIITLLYGENFSGVGQKYKYADGGGVENDGLAKAVGSFYVATYDFEKAFDRGGIQKLQKIIGEDLLYKKANKWFFNNPKITNMSISELNELTSTIKSKIPKRMADGGGVGENWANEIKVGDEVYARWNETNKWTLGTFIGETENGFEVYDFTIERPNHIEFYAQISKQPYPYGSEKVFFSKKFKDRNYNNYHFNKYAEGGNIGNENAEMVMSYNKQIAHHTKEMNEAMSKKGEVPAWVVAKMTRSASDLSDATHFMEGKGESYAKGGAIGDNVHITDEKSLMNNKSGVIIGDEGTFWLVKTLNGTGLVKKSKVKVIEDFAKGGYTPIPYNLKMTGVYEFKTNFGLGYEFDVVGTERYNDTEDMLYFSNGDTTAKNELGSIIVKNNAIRKLAKGQTISAISKNGIKGKITRIKDLYVSGGGVGNEIAELKAKIEKAKKNTIMPENLKKQYIEKYEKELAELEPKKEMNKGKIKLKEILIHWAEGDNSKYDKFPKKYKTWESANKAIIPIYKDNTEDGIDGGYNKVKFTVTFEDNENYDGRLDVSEKEDNPTKTHNVIGQHIKDYLDYQLSEKSRTSEASKKEILEWLGKYDLGLEEVKLPKKETIENTIGFEDIMVKNLISPKGNTQTLSVTYYPENKKLKYRIYIGSSPQNAFTNKEAMEESYNKILNSYLQKGYKIKSEPKKETQSKVETKETTKVSKKYDYIPQRDIEQIKSKQGTIENKDILDGAYVKKGWKHKK